MFVPFLTIFIIIVLALAFRYRQINQRQKDMQDRFWEREAAANATPPVDLATLTYITIPLERFPLDTFLDQEMIDYENKLRALSTERILNLTGLTNTDIKETYGVSNLEEISTYGERFDELTILLKDYAQAFLARGAKKSAISVLEYGVSIHTDISQHYILLGKCYQDDGQFDKISYLMEQVKERNLLLTPSILRQLEDMLPPEN